MRPDHLIGVYIFCSHFSSPPPLPFFKLLFRNSIQVSKSIKRLFTISVLMNKHYLTTLRLKWQFPAWCIFKFLWLKSTNLSLRWVKALLSQNSALTTKRLLNYWGIEVINIFSEQLSIIILNFDITVKWNKMVCHCQQKPW